MKYNLNNAVGNIMKGRSVASSLLSGLSIGGIAGSLLRGMLFAKETADVYITDLETNDSMQLSYVPEKVTAGDGSKFQNYNIIERGEVKIPKGVELTSVSWSAILPGEAMRTYPFIKQVAWESPASIVKRWNKWKDKGTKLNVMVTQTPINLHVYLKNFTCNYDEGLGNIKYSIDFVQAKDMLIKTVEEADADKAATEAAEAQDQLNDRPSMEMPDSMMVMGGQNIWTVAQAATGNGGCWPDILANNAGKVSSADDVLPGTIISLR